VFSSFPEAIMRVFLRSVFAVGAAILAAGVVTPAMAGDGRVHVLTVQLPGGGVEQIEYTGDVAPQVVFVPTSRMVAVPMMDVDPFATLNRISAMMDRQAAAMLREVESMQGNMLPGLPRGAGGDSFVSTMSGSGVCTSSVRITYNGGNAPPQMVSSSSGDCGSDRRQSVPSEVTVPAPVGRPSGFPGTVEVKAKDRGTVRQVALAR
jgi:hypothetical protein